MKKRVLILGAHPDDPEIGCMGYMLKNKESIIFDIVVACGNEDRKKEMDKAMNGLIKNNIDIGAYECLGFQDGIFSEFKKEFKKYLANLRTRNNYDLILTHYREDMHQDHRGVSESTLETFRSEQIMSYEIPKYDGCSFRPSYYVRLEKNIIEGKVAHLTENYESQQIKKWYVDDLFYSWAKIRGLECNSDWAEAYCPVKLFN